jgi:hypothetical protein
MRDRINEAVKDAMKSGEKRRLATLRLITAALKDRDLGIGAGAVAGAKIADEDVVQLLQKMVKQRRDSITQYSAGGRQDLVDQELAEIKVIEEFLPAQMDEAAVRAAVESAVKDTGAAGLKDMGKVMGALKAKYAGKMDFAKANGVVKELLT